MTKKQIAIGVVAGIAAMAVLIGGFFVLNKPEAKKTSFQSTGSQAVSQNEIPLNQTGSASVAGSGLGVSSAGSASLGQLNNGQGSSSNSGNNGSSASQMPDPSTFGQYEKYKDGNGALFGDVQKGTGDELIANKKAAVFYKGWLTNGQLFDQSRTGSDGKLEPFIFTEGAQQVIPGWEQGVLGMKEGGVRLIIVPPAVGYGAQAQNSIPPNSVLIFVVQLLEVQ